MFTISSKYLLMLILVVRYLIDFIRSRPLLQLFYLAVCVVYVAELGGPAPNVNQGTQGTCYLHEYFANKIFFWKIIDLSTGTILLISL